MPTLPINLNLALILHRLLVEEEGWLVDDLTDELGISARTYRKYRKLLQDHLTPHLERHHGVQVSEQRREERTYLTLSPLPQTCALQALQTSQLRRPSTLGETRTLRLRPEQQLETGELEQDILYALTYRRTLEVRLMKGRGTFQPLTLWSAPDGLRLIARKEATITDIALQSIHTIEAIGRPFLYPAAYNPDTYITSRDPLDHHQ